MWENIIKVNLKWTRL